MTLGFTRILLVSSGLFACGQIEWSAAVTSEESPAVTETNEAPQSLPTEASEDWWSVVQNDIAQSEYHIRKASVSQDTTVGETWQAPNRSQNFRTLFTPKGIRVIPRAHHASEAPPWEWGLTLTAWGVDGSMQSVWQQPQLLANGNRMEYRREGITEWYVNDTRGLEQGFTIERRPVVANPQSEASVDRGLLRVEMQVTGNVHALLTDANMAVDFLAPGGARVIHFNGLHTVDSAGNVLPCWFEVCDENLSDESSSAHASQRLSIVVNDSNAVYPIIIDPLATSPSWTAEANQTGANFGTSVGTAGDVNGDGFSDVIVGAPLFDNGQSNEGLAFVYHGSSAGLSAIANWTAESDQAFANFGFSVSTAGDVNGDGYSDVIVGAPHYIDFQAVLVDAGRIWVFHGSPTGLNAVAAWTVLGDQASEQLGYSVSTAGDVNGDGFSDVIVGAPFYDSAWVDVGRILVYLGSAAGLSNVADWSAVGTYEDRQIGTNVATAGDVNGDGLGEVIVGGRHEINQSSFCCFVNVYRGSATEILVAWWNFDGFGQSAATAGDVNGDGFSDVVIGDPEYSTGLFNEFGRIHVFYGTSTGFNAPTEVVGGVHLAQFGAQVATAGDVNGDGYSDVVVGAPDHTNGQFNEGAAFVYLGSATGISLAPEWSFEGGQESARFGSSVFTAGDVNGDGFSDVIVGARLFDNGHADEGRVFVYQGSAAGLRLTPNWTAESNQVDARFGTSVASAGDVNGDGYGDVIIGAHHYDTGQANQGRVFVYHGSASGLGATPSWFVEDDNANIQFGFSASTAGDVNGDGYSDVIIGAKFLSSEVGRAYVYHGSASGLSAVPNWTAGSDGGFGLSVATAGDVNGDGYSDVIVGAIYYSNGQTNEGRAFVWHGSAAGVNNDVDGTSANARWTAESNSSFTYLGFSVATAGDVNGDGYSDVIVGAVGYANGQGQEGGAFVWHGSAQGVNHNIDGTLDNAHWTGEGNQTAVNFGVSVATAGDVNGDGFSDIIVGTYYTSGQTGEGRAYVYHGSALGLSLTANWTAEGDQLGADFGYAVDAAGDVNGDGYSDVIVGAHSYTNGQIGEGLAYVYHGSASGLSLTHNWTAEGNQDLAYFGDSVASAGDVNGDGYGDIIIAAPSYDNEETNEGRVFVYYGNGGPNRVTLPRQQRTDSINIAPLGVSDLTNQFRVRFIMLSVFGRTQLRSQYEVKPRGTPFNGQNLIAGGYFDTGNDGAISYTRLIGGLTAGTEYHWRIRAGYDMVKTPFQKFGPWIHIPTNGWNEADLRTAGTAPTGACCLPNGSCNGAVKQIDCVLAGGVYQGNNVLCSSVSCPQPNPADLAPPGGDGVVSVPDLLVVINAWGPCANPNDCPADVAPPPDGDGSVGVADLLFIINNWGPSP